MLRYISKCNILSVAVLQINPRYRMNDPERGQTALPFVAA